MFEINYSQLIQYEILEKLVTYIVQIHINIIYGWSYLLTSDQFYKASFLGTIWERHDCHSKKLIKIFCPTTNHTADHQVSSQLSYAASLICDSSSKQNNFFLKDNIFSTNKQQTDEHFSSQYEVHLKSLFEWVRKRA